MFVIFVVLVESSFRVNFLCFEVDYWCFEVDCWCFRVIISGYSNSKFRFRVIVFVKLIVSFLIELFEVSVVKQF